MGIKNTIKKVCKNCPICGKAIFRYPQKRNAKFFYCSKKHYNKHLKKRMLGKGNPNYGNKWSNKKRDSHSKKIKQQMRDPYRRWLSGTANRGKKFSKARCKKMHQNRTPESYKKSSPSKKTRLLIGKKSKEKFTKEFMKRRRKIMEERGHWIPLDKKSDYQIYFKEAEWGEKMFDRVTDKKQLNLLKNRGVFNAYKNKGGVVRDHMYSRKAGFENKVFPEILRHPGNCQIILHKDNVAKRMRSKNSTEASVDTVLTLDELFGIIIKFNGNWPEHGLVLNLIEQYKKGNKWIRKV